MATAAKVRTLVVDDSALVRSIVRSALERHPRIEVVGMAADGIQALKKIAALRPDVVTLDVEMPNMNGIGVLERVAGKVPVSFVMVSTLTQAGARVTLEALRKGAFDYIAKPQRGMASVPGFRRELQQKVLAAAAAKQQVKRIITSTATTTNAPSLPPNQARGWLVGIGISCGGPQTLALVLPAFPSDFVPIVITQHMPPVFTTTFAKHMDEVCAMKVREAGDGELIQSGTILIAPGSHHLRIMRRGIDLYTRLDAGPKVSGHRPSVDVMFESMARTCGPRCVAAIMTGMGNDGAAAIGQLKQAGAWTIAQDQASSFVFGMPKAAITGGCVDHTVPAERIPHAIARMMLRGHRRVAGVS